MSGSCQAVRAVARSENPRGHVILGGDNVPSLVEIGLTDLPKSGGHVPPRSPRRQRQAAVIVNKSYESVLFISNWNL